MGKEYYEKLKDPRWQKKRLKILERDKWTCQRCNDDENTLHVHHKVYVAGAEPWDYKDEYLVTLCEDCHEHEKEAMNDYIFALTYSIKTRFLADDVFSLVSGFCSMPLVAPPDVQASALEYVLKNKSMMKNLVKIYELQLTKKE